jgi:hypothetical protein
MGDKVENTLIVIAFAVIVYGLAAFIDRNRRKPFDPAQWQASPKDRWRLVHDLIKRTALTGLNRSDVVALLGKPDYESDCSIAYFLTGDQFGDKLRIRVSADGSVFKAKTEWGC